MNNQVLSIEQMQELIELGIDTFKASACWYPDDDLDYSDDPIYIATFAENVGINYPGRIPTFTLQDMLEMLPKYIYIKETDQEYKYVFMPFGNFYIFQYIDTDRNETALYTVCKINMLEATFEMFKWSKQNNFI